MKAKGDETQQMLTTVTVIHLEVSCFLLLFYQSCDYDVIQQQDSFSLIKTQVAYNIKSV